MPVYQWVGNDSSNKKVKGEEEAPNEDAVRTKLIRQKITPSKIKEKPKDLFENIAMFQPKITGEDVIVLQGSFPL